MSMQVPFCTIHVWLTTRARAMGCRCPIGIGLLHASRPPTISRSIFFERNSGSCNVQQLPGQLRALLGGIPRRSAVFFFFLTCGQIAAPRAVFHGPLGTAVPQGLLFSFFFFFFRPSFGDNPTIIGNHSLPRISSRVISVHQLSLLFCFQIWIILV
ncbi:hypothetical protein FN846DRAFT_976764 [Sphaerosporella brunnea]|uniref:Uncharacterized protein n=1 Tax=Sphaerosporella brunnea TaxID=1250544 RepID=A0A5J5EGL4_9PEZI|nr:hypothetical protein FN846DRAFT_976764 [Sphaerosporella brunnea]